MRDVKPSETNSSDKPKEPQSAPAPPPAPSDPFCVTATAREQGRKMGSAFANLGGESIARARDMSDAIQRGKTEADNHDAYEQFACTDTDELRSRGFYGVDKDF